MAISHVGGGTVQTGTTSLTVTGIASGLQENDFVLMWAFHKSSSVSVPDVSGWTTLTETVSISGTGKYFWRRLGAGVTSVANVTHTGLTSSSVGGMAAFRGVSTISPWVQTGGNNWAGSAHGEGTYGLVTGNWDATRRADCAAVCFSLVDNDASHTSWTITSSSGNVAATELGDNMTTAGTDCGGGWAYALLASGKVVNGFSVAVTEGGAGTASNAADMVVLNAAPTSAPPTPAAPSVSPVGVEAVSFSVPAFPADAEGARLYRDGAFYSDVTDVAGWNYTIGHPDATDAIDYSYAWYNSVGLGSPSPATSVAPVPGTPSFSLTPAADKVTVTITRRSYSAKYKIYRALAGGSRTLYHTSTLQAANGTYVYDDTGVTVGSTYDYHVTTEPQTPTVRESAASSPQNAGPGSFFFPAASTDDGWSFLASGFTTTTLEGGNTGSGDTKTYFRFPSVTLSASDTVALAQLRLYVTANLSFPTFSAYAEDADNPAAPTDTTDLTSRALTTAYGTLDVGEAGTGLYYVDVSTAIEEIISRPGWASGNAIMFILVDQGFGNDRVGFHDFDDANPPRLHLGLGTGSATTARGTTAISATAAAKKSATVVARLAGGTVSAPSVGKKAPTVVAGVIGSQSRAVALKKSPGVAGGVFGGLGMLAAKKSGVVSGLGALGEINTVAATKIAGATQVSGLSTQAIAPLNSSITKILTPSANAATGNAGISTATKRAIASAMEAVGEVPTTVARKVSFAGSAGGSSNIALVNTSTGNTAAGSGTNFTITAPTGISSGDYLLLGVTCRSVVGWTSSPTDDGFTLLRTVSDSTGEMFMYGGFYGTEVTTTSWDVVRTATDKNAWTCVALSGVDTGVEFVAENGQGEASTTVTNHSTPSISPDAQSFLIAFAGDRIDVGSTWTWPSGWTERTDHSGSGTNAVSSSVATYDTNPAAASSYSVTATASIASSNAYMWIGALRPAAGAGQPVTVNAGLVLSASMSSIRQAAVSAVRFLAGTATASAKKNTPAVGVVVAGDTNQVLAQKVATTQGSQTVSALPIAQVAKRLTAVVRAPAGTTTGVMARKISVAIVRNCTSASLRVSLLKRLGAQAMGAVGLYGSTLAKKKTPATGSGAVGQVPSSVAVHRGRVVSIAQSVASGIHQGFIQKRLTPSVTQSVAGKSDVAAKKVSTTTAKQAVGAAQSGGALKRIAAQGRTAFGHAGSASTVAVATIAVNAASFLSGVQQGLVQKISKAGSNAPLPIVIKADGAKRAPATAKQASGSTQDATSKKTAKATGTQSTGARQAAGATKRGVAVGRAIAGVAPRSVTSSVAQVAATAAAYLSGLHAVATKKIAKGSGAGAAGASSAGAGAKKTGVTGRSVTAGNILSAARKRVAVSGISELGVNATGLVGAVRIATAAAAARAGVLLRSLATKNVLADTRQEVGIGDSSAAFKAAVVDASANQAAATAGYVSKTAKAAGELETPVAAGAGASKRSFVDALAGLSVSDDASAVTRRAASVVSAVGSFLRAVSEAFLGQVPNVIDGDVLISTPESVVVVDQAMAEVEISGGIADVIVDQEVGVVDVISGTLDLTIDD